MTGDARSAGQRIPAQRTAAGGSTSQPRGAGPSAARAGGPAKEEPADERYRMLDGPTLREVREEAGVPLRRIARTAGMSHGHLSKVERGEYGRPVTPVIATAYERVLRVKLPDLLSAPPDEPQRRGQLRDWRPGRMGDLRRRMYTAQVGAVAVGGPLGQPWTTQLAMAGRVYEPAPVTRRPWMRCRSWPTG